MCFEIVSNGVYKYHDIEYHEVDCGGGGNCLFLSIAYLLRFDGIDAAATHQKVREYSAAVLKNWAEAGIPEWVSDQHYEKPTTEEAATIARAGQWGTKTSALAVIAHYMTFDITILGPEFDDVYHLNNLLAIEEDRPRIYLFYSGYNHFRALIPKDRVDEVPKGMRVDSDAERKFTKTLFGSLKTTGTSSLETNTSAVLNNSYLEIHHIDVGQGDATLIYVKDESKAIVKSILIDTGESFDPVSKYFETYISYGDFRPLDMMIFSHWDKDHMGAAAQIIQAEKYTQKDLRIIDLGNPENEDRDAATFLEYFGDHPNRELPSLYEPLVDDCLGFSLDCYMFNGLVKSEMGEGYVVSFIEDDVDKYGNEIVHNHSQDIFFGKTSRQLINARNQLFPTDKNNRSMALVVRFHGFTYFTAGDLSGDFEMAVAAGINNKFGHSCAWKLGHHGAGEASSPHTLLYLRPRFGVVSCGSDNDYGHPSPAAIEHLSSLNKIAVCDYYVTTKIPALASGKKFQPGQITGISHALDSQGDTIIKVRSADKDTHTFEVFSNAFPKGKEFKCGVREYNEKDKIPKSQKRSRRITTGEDELEKEKRRRDRISNSLPVIKKALKNRKEVDDDWLKDKDVIRAMENLANRIRDYGEEKIKETIQSKFSRFLYRNSVNSAEDLIKLLKY